MNCEIKVVRFGANSKRPGILNSSNLKFYSNKKLKFSC